MSLSSSPARMTTSQKIRNILSGSRRGSLTSPRSESPSLSICTTPSSSLNNSPVRIIRAKCHQCNRDLNVDTVKELFLAIRCTCVEPPYYYCSPECHRGHWISMNTRGNPCEYYPFTEYMSSNIDFPLSVELKWNDLNNIHNLYHYVDCIYK